MNTGKGLHIGDTSKHVVSLYGAPDIHDEISWKRLSVLLFGRNYSDDTGKMRVTVLSYLPPNPCNTLLHSDIYVYKDRVIGMTISVSP